MKDTCSAKSKLKFKLKFQARFKVKGPEESEKLKDREQSRRRRHASKREKKLACSRKVQIAMICRSIYGAFSQAELTCLLVCSTPASEP
jgi:hypothetical protein